MCWMWIVWGFAFLVKDFCSIDLLILLELVDSSLTMPFSWLSVHALQTMQPSDRDDNDITRPSAWNFSVHVGQHFRFDSARELSRLHPICRMIVISPISLVTDGMSRPTTKRVSSADRPFEISTAVKRQHSAGRNKKEIQQSRHRFCNIQLIKIKKFSHLVTDFSQ